MNEFVTIKSEPKVSVCVNLLSENAANVLALLFTWEKNKGFVTASTLVPIVSEEPGAPVNTPFTSEEGKVTSPFKVREVPFKFTFPAVCV